MHTEAGDRTLKVSILKDMVTPIELENVWGDAMLCSLASCACGNLQCFSMTSSGFLKSRGDLFMA